MANDDCQPEVVDLIARVTVASSEKQLTFYSFASKYCSWHKPNQYPIWDFRVNRYLRIAGPGATSSAIAQLARAVETNTMEHDVV